MPNPVTLNGYTITFLGAACTNGTQIWRYSVTFPEDQPPSPEISNWALALCNDPRHQVDPEKATGPLGSTVVVDMGQPCLVDEPWTIKWEDINNENVSTAIYTFIIENGCFQTTEVPVAVKAGGGPDQAGCDIDTIPGPSCLRIPTTSRGFRL